MTKMVTQLNEKFSKTLNKKLYDETSSKFKAINSLVKEAEKKNIKSYSRYNINSR